VYADVSGINPDLVLNSTVTLSGSFVCDDVASVGGTFTVSIYVQEV
jgi:acyl-[acyl carrier protein]--UDP-N-acetylglucosamine O-acyltransferase